MDLIIAMVIFVLIITIFYSLLATPENTRPRQLQEEGLRIASKLESSSTACDILDHGTIDRTQLDACFQMSVEQFRRSAGIRNRFCIYIQDQNGRTIALDRIDGGNLVHQLGFGDPELEIAGVGCGTTAAGP